MRARGYNEWDAAARRRCPTCRADPTSERSCTPGPAPPTHCAPAAPVLDAWRDGGLSLLARDSVWTPTTTARLIDYLAQPHRQPLRCDLQGLDDDAARVLAAEALVLLLAPFSDMVGTAKRSRVRNPLLG